MVIAQQITNVRTQGLAGLQQRRKAEIARQQTQRQIAEQERSTELEQRRIAEELRTPEQKALEELQSIPAPAEGQRIFDQYGGVVVSFDENVIGLAKATGISPRVAFGLVQSGQLKMQGENIVYKGVAIGSSTIAEQEALRIVTARSQTGTTDSYTPTSTASQVQRIAESNKDLSAGEVLDIAREAKIIPTIPEAKPQLQFFPSKEGTLTYKKITEPVVEQKGFLKPALVVSLPLSTKEALKETYKRNIAENVRGKGIWKVIGTTTGIIEGTGEIVGKASGKFVEKMDTLAYKLGLSSQRYSSSADIASAQILGKTVTTITPYAIPYVGEALLVGQGVEKVVKGETFGEKAFGVFETGLGAIGIKARIAPKIEVLAPPKKLEVFTTSESRSAMTIENIPRAKIVKNVEGEVIGVGTSRGGTQTIVRPIETPTSTLIEGKNWLQVQKSMGDKAEGVIFVKKKAGLVGDYAVTYTSKGGRTDYNIYQQTAKGLRKVDNQKVDISEDVFKFTEPIQKSKTKVQTIKTTPDLFKIRTIKEKRVLEQELVKTGKSKYNILEDKGLQTKIVRKKVTEVSPAEIKGKLGTQFFEPKPVTETGEIIETSQVNLIKKLKPKFAREQPPDIEEIKGLVAKEKSRSLGTLEGKTPRFKDIDITKQTIEGQYTLYAPSKAEKLAKALIPASKKGQGTILELQENKLLSFKDIQKVSVPKVSEYIPSTSETSFTIPTITSEGRRVLNIGGVSSLVKIKPESKIESKILQTPKVESEVRNIALEKVGLNLKSDMKVETKVAQELNQRINQLQKQEFKFKEQSLLETRTPRPSRPEPRTPKKPRPIEFELKFPSERKSRIARETLGKLYEAFARTKGEDISLGKFTTKRIAEETLSKQLKSTLKASGFIEQAGRKLRATELGLLGSEFTPSKVDIFRIVQRKGRRLSARPEVSEIQFFKSKSRKRSSFF